MEKANLKNQSVVKTRDSGIELLKIFSCILIIISNVVSTLHNPNSYIEFKDYFLNISAATTDVQTLLLVFLQHSALIGNTVFFVCSAWFLLDSNRADKKKILRMLIDIWVISVLILIIVYCIRGGNLSLEMAAKQLFPTILGNNWYMTCYLLIYPIHPFLNRVVEKADQKTLLRGTLVMLLLYTGINFIAGKFFFTSQLILWIAIYFAVAYMKYYLTDSANNIKINIAVFAVGFAGNTALILLTNVLGLHIGAFSNGLLMWAHNNSPFVILMAVGLFNIARNIHFESKAVNYIAKLSMFIYLIHENMLLRTYYRPKMWQYVYENMGYGKVAFWALVIVLIVFVFSLVLSVVYDCTIHKAVIKITDKLYVFLSRVCGKIEQKLLKIH